MTVRMVGEKLAREAEEVRGKAEAAGGLRRKQKASLREPAA